MFKKASDPTTILSAPHQNSASAELQMDEQAIVADEPYQMVVVS
jgi:hypothetical protein